LSFVIELMVRSVKREILKRGIPESAQKCASHKIEERGSTNEKWKMENGKWKMKGVQVVTLSALK
jgi:hypothetical protein